MDRAANIAADSEEADVRPRFIKPNPGSCCQ